MWCRPTVPRPLYFFTARPQRQGPDQFRPGHGAGRNEED